MNKKTVVFSTIIFSLFFTSLLIFPKKTKAAIDQRCFTKQECIDAHKDAKNPESFFYEGDDAKRVCGEQMYNPESGEKEPAGFCSPEGRAVTQVSFAGKGTEEGFANLGEFIQFMYKWSMTAGAILAVIVILVSGIQWTISMGKKNVIKKAKSRIAGAIAGLALIATAYTILGTINPALVNMRLPQAWMIKAETIKSLTCKDVEPAKTRIAKAGPTGKEDEWTKKEDISEGDWFKVETIEGEDKKTCGSSYHVEGSSGQQCQGVNCPGNKVCLPFSVENNQIKRTGSKCTEDKFVVQILPSDMANTINKNTLGDLYREAYGAPTDADWLRINSAEVFPFCRGGKLAAPQDVNVNAEIIKRGENGEKRVPNAYLLKFSYQDIEAAVRSGCTDTYTSRAISKPEQLGFMLGFNADESWSASDTKLYIVPSSNLAREGGVGTGLGGSINNFPKEIVGVERKTPAGKLITHLLLVPGEFSFFKLNVIKENTTFAKVELSTSDLRNVFSNRLEGAKIKGYLDWENAKSQLCANGPFWLISNISQDILTEAYNYWSGWGINFPFKKCQIWSGSEDPNKIHQNLRDRLTKW